MCFTPALGVFLGPHGNIPGASSFPEKPENQRIGAKVREAILIPTLPGDPGRVIFISEIIFSCENGNNNNTAYFMELL